LPQRRVIHKGVRSVLVTGASRRIGIAPGRSVDRRQVRASPGCPPAATAAFAALDLAAGTYNATDDEPLRHREFVDSLADALGVRHPRMVPAWLAALAGPVARTMARSLRISNAKLRAAGWAPRYRSARDGWPDVVARLPRPTVAPGGHPGEART